MQWRFAVSPLRRLRRQLWQRESQEVRWKPASAVQGGGFGMAENRVEENGLRNKQEVESRETEQKRWSSPEGTVGEPGASGQTVAAGGEPAAQNTAQGRTLPDAELAVMQALWDCAQPVQRQQLERVLRQKHPMATTTVLTLLTRLGQKGFVRIEKQGRGALYSPLVGREAYLARQSEKFYQQVCGGSVSAFAAALCHSGLSRQELDELRRLLEENAL